MLELRSASGGTFLGRWKFFTPEWIPVAAAALEAPASAPSIAVLATNTVSGQAKIQFVDIGSNGKSNVFVFGSGAAAVDLGVTNDGNGDGVATDPAFLVLGEKSGGNTVVRLRDVATGTKIADITMLNASWRAESLTVLPDQNFNGGERGCGPGRERRERRHCCSGEGYWFRREAGHPRPC